MFFGLTAGLAVMAHPIALLLLPPLGVALALHMLGGRRQNEKRGARFVLALFFSMLFAAPFLLKAVDYIIEHSEFVTAAFVGGSTGPTMPERAHLWAQNNLWDFLGPWFAVFFVLVLLAAAIRFLSTEKRDALSWYTLAALIYYPAGSLYITLNEAMTYDFMFMQVLLIPLLLREAYLLFAEKWTGKAGRVVLAAALCLAVTAGVVEKNSVFQPLREDAAPDAYPNYLAHRRMLYRLDLGRQTIEDLLRMDSGRRVVLTVQQLTRTADGRFSLEPPTDEDRQIFHFLETSAALDDLLLRYRGPLDYGWKPFELAYCRFEEPVDAKEIARAIRAFRAAWDDGRTLDWSYAVRRGTHATIPILTDSFALTAIRRVP